MESMSKDDLFKRVNELTEHIDRVEKEYAAYKEIAEKTLDQRWNADGEGDNLRKAALTEEQQEGDKGYFSSYSFTGKFQLESLEPCMQDLTLMQIFTSP